MNIESKRPATPFMANVLDLFRCVEEMDLTHVALRLQLTLLAMMNRHRWPDELPVSDRMLAMYCHMNTRSLVKARDELAEAGVLTFRVEGGGKKTRCVYSLVAMTKCKAVQNSVATTSLYLKQDGKDEDKEKTRVEKVTHEEMTSFMMKNEAWVGMFCQRNGISTEMLLKHVEAFVLHLQNQGIVEKDTQDLFRHFGAWYDKQNQHQVRQEMERQRQQEQQRRAAAEAREEARRREEEQQRLSIESFRRTVEGARVKAAQGDPHAIEFLKKYEASLKEGFPDVETKKPPPLPPMTARETAKQKRPNPERGVEAPAIKKNNQQPNLLKPYEQVRL